MFDRLATVHCLQPLPSVAGTAGIGGVRPSSNGRRAGGRYVLGDLLGRGGMAEVFAGHSLGDHGFQKPIAIKRLLPELANDDVFVERLIGEAKLLVGMQHGNIVSVIDLARDGDDVFLVMEFVDGPSLRQLLKSRGTRGLSLGTATFIVQHAAQGLEFAHARPGGAIIHADISPSNLLLTTSGEVRVADFGIARREGGGAGIVEGKWAYMAPEQARGEPLTPRSDVFALGVVLYELICGAHPFGRQVTAEERDNEPLRVIPPRVVKPSIPHGIDAICMRALAHDPRDRYARMQTLIDALVEERFANGWRESASDLAQAIRECVPQTGGVGSPRTMITDRPVTIATRSLLRELTPARRASSPSYSRSQSDSQSQSASGTPPPIFDEPSAIAPSGAQTKMIVTDDVMAAAAQWGVLDLPANLRADGTPMPPFRMPDPSAAGQDLASVIGGHTVTGHVASEPLERGNGLKWVIGVLAMAAVVGAIAAYLIAGRSKPPSETELAKTFENPAVKEPAPLAELGKDLLSVKPPVAAPVEPPAPPVEPPKPVVDTETAPVQAPVEPPKPVDGETAEVAPPVENISGVRRPVAPKKEPGILRVQSEPWAYVTIAGQKRVDTPYKFSLAPGRYIVKFQNDEIGKSVTKTVVVESGRTQTLAVSLEEDN
ncbi:MAG: serine/threonine-protein kinase [Kofleriaceae bacterium]